MKLPPRELIENLKDRLRRLENSHRPSREPVLATGSALQQFLHWGTLVEWLGDGEGSGAATLALAVVPGLLERGGVLVVIDSKREFYPPAAAGLGIPLEHTVIVQPHSLSDALWAWEQCLRCRAVAVALGWLGKLNDRVFRRLQLAAETGGGLGFLLRPAACRAEPSWAEVRLVVNALPSRQSSQSLGWRFHIETLPCRGGAGGEAELELSHETGSVCLAPALADPAVAARAAGA